ncbi:MAG: DivIVA domain-containing protein [Acidimicrobiales bacterium]|nr:DivIVA domain-containing protein [Acidimicrobiales bacterium]
MDELSPLFQEIEFHERLRGYDPDEVDAYVDRVARAAAVLRGRLIELQERVDAAESRSHGGPSIGGTEAEETLTRTLVLAQRTADAAIAEAREEADRMTADAATSAQAIVSAAEADAQVTLREAQAEAAATIRDAEDRASLTLAEAETDRRTILAEAEVTALEAASGERDRLAAEVAELQDYRAFLADDIEILERHLADERHQLTASLSALTDLLESPDAFRSSRPPETSGVEVDADRLEAIGATFPEIADPEIADSEVAAVPVEAAAVPVEEPEPVTEEPDEPVEAEVAEPVAEAPVEAEIVEPIEEEDEVVFTDVTAAADTEDEPATIDLVDPEPDEPALVEEPLLESIDLDAPDDDGGAGSWDDEPAWADEPVAYAGRLESRLEAPEASPPRFVTAADLDSVNTGSTLAFDDGGPATAPVPSVGDLIDAAPIAEEASLFAETPESTEEDPFLAQLRDAMEGEVVAVTDDDALTAFFDQEDDDGGRSWFGRRR